ncbi:porin [Paraburkholderia sp. 32]|uniref:porin n=1 Tax=Paraburkholderia sp. 32 TaxID=2991057 RepID=UPI003D197977
MEIFHHSFPRRPIKTIRRLSLVKRTRYSALCAVALLAGTNWVYAQSSATLYGIVDDSLSYNSNSNGHSLWSLASQKRWPNMWGMTGTEDLGGGLSAVFRYETGIQLNTGGSYTRQTWVGLSDKKYGVLTLGKQYDAAYGIVPFTTAIDNSTTAAHAGNYDRGTGLTLNNTIKYQSEPIANTRAMLFYSFGSPDSGTTNTGRGVGGNLVYSNGPYNLYLSYQSINGTTISPATDIGVHRMFGQNFSARSFLLDHSNVLGVGAMYRTQDLKVTATFTQTKMAFHNITETMSSYEVGGRYNVMPDVIVQGAYSYSTMDQYKWDVFAVSSAYLLSKRSQLFTTLVYQQTGGDGQVAVLNGESPSTTNKQLVLRVGILHKF